MNTDEIINKWEKFGLINDSYSYHQKYSIALACEEFTKNYIDDEVINEQSIIPIIIQIYSVNGFYKLDKIIADIKSQKIILDKMKEIIPDSYNIVFIKYYIETFLMRKDIEKFL